MDLGKILSGVFQFLFPSWWDDDDKEGSGWLSNAFGNIIKKYSGSGLTDAEKEANAFSAQQSQDAFNREANFQREMFGMQTELANTQYQRAVADMKAAGINPMLAAGNGGSAVPAPGSASSSAASSVSPQLANLGGLISAIAGAANQSKEIKLKEKALDSQIDLNEANAEKARADAGKSGEETRGNKLQNDYFAKVKELREEGERLANELKAGERRKIDSEIRKADQDIVESMERCETEREKRILMASQEMLNNCEAENIIKMRPFVQAEMSARTAQEKAAAQVALVDVAYRQGLIDEGAV